MRVISPYGLACLTAATAERVYADCDHEDDAGSDVFGAGRLAEQVKPVLHTADDECAEHGVVDFAAPTEEAGAADDGRRDGIEPEPPPPGAGGHRKLPAGAAEPAQRGEPPAED